MIDAKHLALTEELLSWIAKAPTAYQTVEQVESALMDAGYEQLTERDMWHLRTGGKYYVVRNGSSLIAFRVPKQPATSFLISAAHTDSPAFKLKEQSQQTVCTAYVRLNTEVYGGTIFSSWLDRPLSVAGRLIIRDGNRIFSKTVCIQRDLLLIPSVAIHQNRGVNDGIRCDPANDTLPLWSMSADAPSVRQLVAQAAQVRQEDILSQDLYVYNRMPGTVFGADDAFFAAPRIDDLMCVFACLRGFLNSTDVAAFPVYAIFDNEETGSATKQGAGSFFLRDVLQRICDAFNLLLPRALACSMMVSADNGHARHPNHPELSDPDNAPLLNGGVVLKSNAAQRYATDGMSFAVFSEICRRAQVPVQLFANRSDMPGGSTLGSISNTLVPLCTVDLGAAQLAMHAAYETAGCVDVWYLAKALQAFFQSRLLPCENGFILE